MKINQKTPANLTHEGAVAKHINSEQQLRRSVMSCLLWEKEFYEDGEMISCRIKRLIPIVNPEIVRKIAIEAREEMKLRHVPLLIVREMARSEKHRKYVAETLRKVIQRADELTEFLAIYWKEGKQSLSSQVKKGLALAFTKFDEYQLAKYNRDGAVKLRDVLFLCHAKPKDEQQAGIWKRLINGNLKTPDTWEVALSDKNEIFKKDKWIDLLKRKRLGGLALLRNLRNMEQEGIDRKLIKSAISEMKTDRILPFRFIAAARYAPNLEPELEIKMFASTLEMPKLKGNTFLLIDVSGFQWIRPRLLTLCILP